MQLLFQFRSRTCYLIYNVYVARSIFQEYTLAIIKEACVFSQIYIKSDYNLILTNLILHFEKIILNLKQSTSKFRKFCCIIIFKQNIYFDYCDIVFNRDQISLYFVNNFINLHTCRT